MPVDDIDALTLTDLKRSGITEDDAKRAHIRTLSTSAIKSLLGQRNYGNQETSGYEIPYLNLDGKTPFVLDGVGNLSRIRFTGKLPVNDDGKILRYASKANVPWGIYIPVGFLDCFKAANKMDNPVLVITEGEKKAFSGVLAGLPTLGIPGVTMWHNPFYPRGEDEPINPATPVHPILLDTIAHLLNPKWSIVVLYDYDGPVTNRKVVSSMTKLSRALRHQSWYAVSVAGIPAGQDDTQKRGLDDWLLDDGLETVLSKLQYFTKVKTSMPNIIEVPSGRVPLPNSHSTHKVELAARLLFDDPESQKSQSNAETCLVMHPAFANLKPEEIRQLALDSMRWVKIAGNSLKAKLTWHAVEESSTWFIEEWDSKNFKIIHKALNSAPAAWIHRYFSLADDAFSAPQKRVAEIRGFANDGKIQELQFDAELESSKATWIDRGFRNVVDKGLEEWRKITQHQLAIDHTQVTAISHRGWLDVAHSGLIYRVYCYGKRAVIPEFDVHNKDIPRIEAVRLSKAQQDSSAAILTRGDAVKQKKWFSELLSQSPAFAGLAGFTCAAGLMDFVPEAENGIVHLFGDSSEGKTSTMQILASMLGSGDSKGRYSQIMGWRLTSNGLESPLMAHSDAPIFMDELHLLPANEDLSELLYMVANGAGKSRMKSDISERPAMRWRVQMLSNGEKSIEGSLGTHKNGTKGLQSFTGGLKVRVMDIPFDKLDLMPEPHQIPYIIENYGQSSNAEYIGKKVSAEALERAAETDCGWLWPELIGYSYHWSKNKEWNPRKAYTALSDSILNAIPKDSSNIVKRRVKHVAISLVGLIALVSILDLDKDTQEHIIQSGRDWLQGVLLAIGIGDSVSGKESDHVMIKVDEHISTHPERFIMGSLMAAGLQYGWRNNTGHVVIPVGDGLPALANSLNMDAKRLKAALLNNGWKDQPRAAPHLKTASQKMTKIRSLISVNPYFTPNSELD